MALEVAIKASSTECPATTEREAAQRRPGAATALRTETPRGRAAARVQRPPQGAATAVRTARTAVRAPKLLAMIDAVYTGSGVSVPFRRSAEMQRFVVFVVFLCAIGAAWGEGQGRDDQNSVTALKLENKRLRDALRKVQTVVADVAAAVDTAVVPTPKVRTSV